MNTQPIFVTKGDLAKIWGVTPPVVTRYAKEIGADGHRGAVIDLEKALESRPILLSEADFEDILQGAAPAARERGLFALFAASDAEIAQRRAVAERNGANAIGPHQKAAAKIEAAPAAQDAAERDTAADLRAKLAQMHLDLQAARVEAQRLKNEQLSGNLLVRTDVDAALTKLGTSCRTILERIAPKVAALVPVEDRAAITDQVNAITRKALTEIADLAEHL